MSVGARVAALTNDALLRRNVILNLLTWILPAASALVAIPILARQLGEARFGMLSLGWAAVGLFSFFDFGLGRALTKMIAERSARSAADDIPDLLWTSAWVLGAISLCLTAIGLTAAPFLAHKALHVPVAFQGEATNVVRWLAIGVLPMAHGVVLRGVLEAEQRFGTANRLRVPLGVATYLGPLLVIPFHGGAAAAVGVIVFARTVYWLAHLPILEHVTPGLLRPRAYSPAAARELFAAGGWITLSNILAPIIGQGDRIAIAVGLPIAASGWYGIASEVATKQWLFTSALQPVLFAALATTIVHDPGRAAALVDRAMKVTMLTLFPVTLVLLIFAEPGLRWWTGPAFALPAVASLRWLALGVYVNASAQVPYAALQGGAGARGPALLHLAELPAYAALLFVLVPRMGVEGAALAFCIRMILDATLMWAMASRELPAIRRTAVRSAWLGGAMLSAFAGVWMWNAHPG